ncbi:hypothetical protein PtA15_11A181 [Puccinia triticina]|uniref:Uncharacterized protein n=1 Tax=Puccinia triticina TaxID=208348 RepID=A0ABY7CZR6_9BASI|nr:uncharacterized protein PtA15_11A181 [Puccinia triticina]WAQ89492.1 hypothetical protein PtA15_11A181 [Puccinia triticina]
MESVVNMGKSGTEILRPALEQPGVEFARQPMGQFHRDIAKKTDTTKPPLEPILDEASIRKPEVGFNPEVLRHEPDPPVPETIFKETADPKISIDPWPTRARENLKEKLSAIRKKIVGLSKVTARAWNNLKAKLSTIRQRIIAYYRPPPSVSGPFDLRLKRQRELSQLVLAHKGVDLGPHVDAYLNQILGEFHKHAGYLQENHSPSLVETWGARLKTSFSQFQKLVVEDDEKMERMMARYNKQIARDMPEILGKNKGAEAVLTLGKKLAAYKSKTLAEDQKIVRFDLPEEQQYLSELLGFFGPNKVLAPEIRALFQEKVHWREWKLTQFVDSEKIIPNLNKIQDNLEEVARFNRKADIARKLKKPVDMQPYHNLIAEIRKTESELVTAFGGLDRFKDALSTVKELDIYKKFMQELKNPQSVMGHQLQFLEPWGYSRTSAENSETYRPFKKFGLRKSTDSINKLDELTPITLEIIQTRLASVRKAQKAEEKIEKIMTPEGLEHFMKFLSTRVTST